MAAPKTLSEEPVVNAIGHPQHIDSFNSYSIAAFMGKEEKTWRSVSSTLLEICKYFCVFTQCCFFILFYFV